MPSPREAGFLEDETYQAPHESITDEVASPGAMDNGGSDNGQSAETRGRDHNGRATLGSVDWRVVKAQDEERQDAMGHVDVVAWGDIGRFTCAHLESLRSNSVRAETINQPRELVVLPGGFY